MRRPSLLNDYRIQIKVLTEILIAFCQTLGLTKEFFSIVKIYPCFLSLFASFFVILHP